MLTIPVGNNVYQSTATFTESGNAVVDPTSVSFVYQVEGEAAVTVTYAGATVPAPGIVARISPGVYVAQVDVSAITSPSSMSRYWQGGGVGASTSLTDYLLLT